MLMAVNDFSAQRCRHKRDLFVFAAPLNPLATNTGDKSALVPLHSCWSVLFGLLFILYLPDFAVAQENAKADPRNVEAAFLRNFAHYVTWPSEVFTDDHAPWRICILGHDPFGKALENTLIGRKEQGRAFEIIRAESLSQLQQCQMVYVAYEVSAKRRAALAALKYKPVLTVSNAPGFLQEGGIIRFQVTDYVEMGVNLDQARSASLKIQIKMLEVSSYVVEDGVVRKVR
jgi:hypothetical protein